MYSYGMQMPGRVSINTEYRYGFNTQEKDDELYGKGNAMAAEYWEYDARIGRRWNIDPITYPWQSSYATFNNNPIYFVDPLGLEGVNPGDRPSEQDQARKKEAPEVEWEGASTQKGGGGGGGTPSDNSSNSGGTSSASSVFTNGMRSLSVLLTYNSEVRLNYAYKAYSLKSILGKENYLAGSIARTSLQINARNLNTKPIGVLIDRIEGTPRIRYGENRFWRTRPSVNIASAVGFGIGVYQMGLAYDRIKTSQDPVRQVAVEGFSWAAAYASMRLAGLIAPKIKNPYIGIAFVFAAGAAGGSAAYTYADKNIPEDQYTEMLIKSLGLISTPGIIHEDLQYCAYCNGKAANSLWPGWYFKYSDPKEWHPENYIFRNQYDGPLFNRGLGYDKVHPSYR